MTSKGPNSHSFQEQTHFHTSCAAVGMNNEITGDPYTRAYNLADQALSSLASAMGHILLK
ncbi:hypothetical protein I79_023181 [Cricetulus griseus]|uniref:Uncharacterized protein n=1 Tax=Cricetulus griseus TaxID=10029 RepID=G3IH93_CRIGR|nr:hypothetical protein I79_023181 [Cricetulus griseus]